MTNTILWDHDGVLVDTERCYFQATAEVLARRGVTLTLQQYQRFHLTESCGSWHLAGDVGEATMAAMREERNARYIELVTQGDVLMPGTLALLQRLKRHYRMAVVTSSYREPFKAIHRATGLPELMAFVLVREDYVESKPDPEPYLTAMARLGVAAADCVVVEDTPRGLHAAQAAGIACWIIRSAMTEGLSFAGAARQFDSLDAVGAALLA